MGRRGPPPRELAQAIVDWIEDREGLLAAKSEIARAPWRHPVDQNVARPRLDRGNLAKVR